MYDVLVRIFWVYSTVTKCKCFTKNGSPDSWFFDSYNENKVTQLLLHKHVISITSKLLIMFSCVQASVGVESNFQSKGTWSKDKLRKLPIFEHLPLS